MFIIRQKHKRFYNSRHAQSFEQGFTMVELLVVSVLLVIISTALFGAFRIGITTFQRVEKDRHHDLAFHFIKERILTDLKSSHPTEMIPFSGERREVSFPGLVRSSSGGLPKIGSIQYRLDSGSQLMRIEQTYSEVVNERLPKRRQVLMDGVTDLQFQYYAYEDVGESYSWESVWDREDEIEDDDKKRFPAAIKITFSVKKKGEQTDREIFYAFPFARPMEVEEESAENV